MRLAAPEHVECPVAEFDELVDRPRDRPVVGHFGKRKRRILNARGDLRLAQVHDAVGFRIWQRTQEHTIDDAEDRRVRADPETERQHEREREPRNTGEVSQSELFRRDQALLKMWPEACRRVGVTEREFPSGVIRRWQQEMSGGRPH